MFLIWDALLKVRNRFLYYTHSFDFYTMKVQRPDVALSQPNQEQKQNCVLVVQPDKETEEFVETITKINGETYTRTYRKLSTLGKGGFAYCYKTKQIQSNSLAATKIINKENLQNFRTKLRLANEIKLHKSLRHENIVKFFNNFEDGQNVYINLELCENGALVDILKNRITFTTPQIQSFLFGICQGVSYLHSQKIIHRDLKLGNIFLNDKNIVKIGDFGLAVKLEFQKQYKRTVCGTPNYLAPEVLEGRGYYFQIDIWAIGIIIYTLFFTYPPFQTEEARMTYELIKKCEFGFPRFHTAPPEALDLIKRILVKNPADRLTINEILESPFMKMGKKILNGLPPCILMKPPSKKQLLDWPSIEQNSMKKQELCEQTSILGFNLRSHRKSKRKFLSPEISLIGKKSLQSEKYQISVHVKIVEQINENSFFYALSNGNFGIFEANSNKNYVKSIFRSQDRKITVINTESLESTETITDAECPYRVILTVKTKELRNTHFFNNREPESEHVNLAKLKKNQEKQLTLIRLSNRSIQIIFADKDGFILQPNRVTVNYFLNIFDDKPFLTLKASDFTSLISEKENKERSISMNKLKKGHKITKNKLTYIECLLKQLQPKHLNLKKIKSLDSTNLKTLQVTKL